MRTLRAKLFFSVGAIFLIVAVLSFIFPQLLVRKDLDKASFYLNQRFEQVQQQILDITYFLITYRLVDSAVELEGSVEVVDQKAVAITPWTLAAQIANRDAEITFVQVSHGNECAVILLQEGQLHRPLWAPSEQGKMWIKILGKQELYEARPTGKEGSYFLFRANNTQVSYFKSFTYNKVEIPEQEAIAKLYKDLLQQQIEWTEKMALIAELVAWREKKVLAEGLLKGGYCILTEEVLSTQCIVADLATRNATKVPFLLLRGGKDLDLVSTAPPSLAVGFSLSSVTKKIAQLIQKPIVLTDDATLALGFTPSGETFDPGEIKKEGKKMVWRGQGYYPANMQIEMLNFAFLIPESQATAITQFLKQLREEIVSKISLNLALTALACLIFALLVLARLSKKITSPIAHLSVAAEELGQGRYEGLKLPKAEKSSIEVERLVHAFEGMVLSLRDREKIRGVLQKVVSKEVAEQILQSNIELGGEERIVTMLFSDIRGFTHLSEHLAPHILIGELNAYMTRMCRIIDETKGVVDKFVGDEIMALYGTPVTLENHAVHAIEAALLMMQHLRQWNKERSGGLIFEIGIGIHTGLVLAGNMGAENRLNYTVIGANVNLAARLCGAAAPLQILISEETLQQKGVAERFAVKALEPLSLKGIDRPVTVYEVITHFKKIVART